MKILFINTIGADVWGGVESWMMRIGLFLRNRGHKIYFAGRKNGKFFKIVMQQDFKILPLVGKWDISPGTILKIARHIDEKNIDLVVVNTNRDLRLGGIAKMISRRKPVIINRRGLPAFRKKLRHKISSKFADFFLVPSEDLKKSLLNFGWFSADKIKVIPNFVNVEKIRQLSQEKCDIQMETDAPIIGAVANLVGQKALHTLIEATAILSDREIKCRTVIVGDGPLKKSLLQVARKLDVMERIFFPGFFKNPFPLVKQFYVLALPSIFEPFGQVLIEAAALGIPSVASDVGGIPEVVVNGETGILVPPENPSALADAIENLIKDRTLRDEMSAKAMERAKLFDVSIVAPQVEEFFKYAINYASKN